MSQDNIRKAPIGIFDSGYGGLTILSEIRRALPQYDYIYLGDNARAPYGTRSFEIVYRFTLEAVQYLFDQGCQLVILACNTASAKALRSIQQNDLPHIDPARRVLGVIRPTVEILDKVTHNGHIGLLGTPGTIQSQSYTAEVAKLYPQFHVHGQACPMWVPLIENNEIDNEGTNFFVKKYINELLAQSTLIDTVILGCTHYPLLYNLIRKHLPNHIQILSQGALVADSLKDYLKRHPEIEQKCSQNGKCTYLTTESGSKFNETATLFLQDTITARQIEIG
ncbi:MAG: glutamate racemase [Bacteroidaceae bacterium]|nr:glutamate racemase [Bacteroidales bacterium]MBQ2979323.1 glutamate racemase [Bacteroidaceae bacterium]